MTAAAQLLSLAPLPALMFAAMNDVAARRVPDWASALIAACGLAVRVVSGDLLLSLGLALIVFVLLFACWRRCWLGGGDVKLLTACTMLVPADAVPDLLLAIALAGGMLSVAYLLGHYAGLPIPRLPAPRPSPSGGAKMLARLWRIRRIEGWRIRRRRSLPYACAIAAGCMFTLAGV